MRLEQGEFDRIAYVCTVVSVLKLERSHMRVAYRLTVIRCRGDAVITGGIASGL